MEVSIFPKLASDLSRYVEIRLHTDKEKDAEEVARSARFQELKVALTGSAANPIYVIVDPREPRKALAIHEGADLPGGERTFRPFLTKNA